MAALQQAFSDPEILLGAVESDAQRALRPSLDAAVATVVGYTDWVVDAVAVRVIGGEARQTELVAEEPTPAREVDRRRSAFTLCAVEYLPHRPQVRDDHARMRIH